MECAVLELQMLGVKLDPLYVTMVTASGKSSAHQKRRRKQERLDAHRTEIHEDQYDHVGHYECVSIEYSQYGYELRRYLDGNTPWGVRFGITWSEFDEEEPESDYTNPVSCADELHRYFKGDSPWDSLFGITWGEMNEEGLLEVNTLDWEFLSEEDLFSDFNDLDWHCREKQKKIVRRNVE